MVWSGWDFGAGTDISNFNLTITLPIAKNPDGSSITGPAYEYIVSPGFSYVLNYPPATLDQTKATLTHRVHLDDAPPIVPAGGWEYTNNGNAIRLLPAGTSFIPNDIYEFSYLATDPTVNGIGFAAVRDFNSFLRYAAEDSAVTVYLLLGDGTSISTLTNTPPRTTLPHFLILTLHDVS